MKKFNTQYGTIINKFEKFSHRLLESDIEEFRNFCATLVKEQDITDTDIKLFFDYILYNGDYKYISHFSDKANITSKDHCYIDLLLSNNLIINEIRAVLNNEEELQAIKDRIKKSYPEYNLFLLGGDFFDDWESFVRGCLFPERLYILYKNSSQGIFNNILGNLLALLIDLTKQDYNYLESNVDDVLRTLDNFIQWIHENECWDSKLIDIMCATYIEMYQYFPIVIEREFVGLTELPYVQEFKKYFYTRISHDKKNAKYYGFYDNGFYNTRGLLKELHDKKNNKILPGEVENNPFISLIDNALKQKGYLFYNAIVNKQYLKIVNNKKQRNYLSEKVNEFSKSVYSSLSDLYLPFFILELSYLFRTLHPNTVSLFKYESFRNSNSPLVRIFNYSIDKISITNNEYFYDDILEIFGPFDLKGVYLSNIVLNDGDPDGSLYSYKFRSLRADLLKELSHNNNKNQNIAEKKYEYLIDETLPTDFIFQIVDIISRSSSAAEAKVFMEDFNITKNLILRETVHKNDISKSNVNKKEDNVFIKYIKKNYLLLLVIIILLFIR